MSSLCVELNPGILRARLTLTIAVWFQEYTTQILQLMAQAYRWEAIQVAEAAARTALASEVKDQALYPHRRERQWDEVFWRVLHPLLRAGGNSYSWDNNKDSKGAHGGGDGSAGAKGGGPARRR